MKKNSTKIFCAESVIALVAFLFAGCSTIPHPVLAKYQPTNIYRNVEVLPPNIKRVVVLPLAVLDSTTLLNAGAETLQSSVYTELEKTKKFEVIAVSSEQLRQLTGRDTWKAGERLPVDFFPRLRQEIGSDAVLFSELTSYQPYPPITIGWKLTLVTSSNWRSLAPESAKVTPEILWSADEVFNAGNPEVANAAEAFSNRNHRNEAPIADSSSIFSSPVRFGQYTLNALFETLPAR